MIAALKDRVIHNVIDDTIIPQGRYPESFVILSFLEVRKDWKFFYGYTLRTLRVPDWNLGEQDHS